MMRDHIRHEHAGQTKEWREPNDDRSVTILPVKFSKANVTTIVFVENKYKNHLPTAYKFEQKIGKKGKK